jgi:GNAT superfamily N-acetyltransferase
VFCSSELAARIERAQSGLVAAGARAATDLAGHGAYVRELAGGVAVCSVPGAALNKVVGLGFGGALDPAALGAVEAAFAARGVPVQVEVAALADPSIVQTLTRRGYVLVGFENVLGVRLPGPAMARPAGIEVDAIGAHEHDLWAQTLLRGFQHPDTQGIASPERIDWDVVARELRACLRVPGFMPILARLDGEVAGGGSMCVHDGITHLCGAATLPAHRRRGVQTALLGERLARAARASCDVAVLTTMPGSKSHENAERHGFAVLYARAMLVKAAV